MTKFLIALTLCIVVNLSHAQSVVINEINADNPGTPDTQEFVELFGQAGYSLNGLVLVFFDGAADTSYLAIDLDGYALNDQGFFVVADSAVIGANYYFTNLTANIQNGTDAVALYTADAADFPNGALAIGTGLIDAQVYYTQDQNDPDLIAALTLDSLSPGYTIIDETALSTTVEYSLSLLPDGAGAYNYAGFVLQTPTPGALNYPPCHVGSFTLSGVPSNTFCSQLLPISIQAITDSTTYGGNYSIVLCDQNGTILDLNSGLNLTLNTISQGNYQVYIISYLGNASGLQTGSAINAFSATDCYDVSAPVTLNIYACAASSPCSSLLISEYIEGVGGGGPNGTSRALELFNTSLNTIALDNYALLQYSNGSSVPTDTLALTGSLGPQGRYVIVSNTGTISQTLTSDLISGFINFTGNDAIALTRNDSIVDMIGIIGNDPGNNGWPVAVATTANNGMRRMSNVQMPEGDWSIAATQWEIFPSNDFSDLGLHTYQSCSSELLIGFVNSSLTIDEDLGNQNISVSVDLQNLTSGNVDVVVTLSGGTADSNDFTFVNPVTLTYDTVGILTLDLTIIDDNILEGSETIVLTLSTTDSSVVWTQQEMLITILQSDANCDVGIPTLANGIFQICDNGFAFIQPDTNEVGSGFLNVIADNSNNIIYTTISDSITASDFDSGNYQIYRVAYFGNLIDSTVQIGMNVNQISSELCVSVSTNALPLEIVTCNNSSVVVINEVNADNPGNPDTQEFVELYGPAGYSLNGMVMVFFDGAADTSYLAIDLDGYALNDQGFFLVADSAFAGADMYFTTAIASIQNGTDAVALYMADTSDFPTGTPATYNNLLDAVVYFTNDQDDPGLIAALGLYASSNGYSVLNETAISTTIDYSNSVIPDGGAPFNDNNFLQQEPTPGALNYPPCHAGLFTLTGVTSNTACVELLPLPVQAITDSTTYGGNYSIVLCDSNGTILALNSGLNLTLNGISQGDYQVYITSYLGNASGLQIGSPIAGFTATDCYDVSTPVIITLQSCSGCDAGTVALNGDSTFTGCSNSSVNLTNTSISVTANYIYALTDMSGVIVSTTDSILPALPSGSYQVYGISYSGSIDAASIAAGASIFSVTASDCAIFTAVPVTLNLFGCAASSPCSSLLISEYIEGVGGGGPNGTSRALELFNTSLNTIALDNYALLQYSNGSPLPTDTLLLTGSLGPQGRYVIVSNTGTISQTVTSDLISAFINFSGNDAIALTRNDSIVDMIGIIGNDPGANGWPAAAATTANNGMRRMSNVQMPEDDWNVAATQWEIFPSNDFSDLGLHTYQSCSSELLIGFVNSSLSIDEDLGNQNITVAVDLQNLTSGTVDVVVTLSGGTADGNDFTFVGPVTLSYNASGSQSFDIAIIDDILTEGAETIVLTLSSADSTVLWLQQELVITILQSDANCDGGMVQNPGGFGPVNQCSDTPNTDITLNNTSAFPNSSYVYLITDANNNIIQLAGASPISLDNLGAGTFNIWGLSYTGILDPNTVAVGQPVVNVASDSCASLSNNFITVNRTPCIPSGCETVQISNESGSSYIVICRDQNEYDFNLITNASSSDASISYFITDTSGNIISQLDGNAISSGSYAEGTYHIYAISYVGNLSNTSAGQPVNGIVSDNCVLLSANYVEMVITNCGGSPCSQLFFSEYLEDAVSNRMYEIFNPTSLDVDLSSYSVYFYSNGSTVPTDTLMLTGSLSPYSVYTVVSSGFAGNPTPPDPILGSAADTLHSTGAFSGNDALELIFNNQVVDVIGIVGNDPGQAGWPIGISSTANHDLVRRFDITAGSSDWNLVSGQWDSYDPTDYSHAGLHEAFVCPVSSVASVSFVQSAYTISEIGGSITVVVNYSNPGESFIITINASGTASSVNDYNYTFPVDLTIPDSSQGSLEIIIPVTLDTLADNGETIVLNMEGPLGVMITNPSTTITITDPPANQAQITFGSTAYTTAESAGVITVTVNYINPGASFDVIIDAVATSTATDGIDYINIFPYTLNIPATSQGTLEFNIEIIADSIDEGDEMIDLSLTAPGNVVIGLSNTTITITGELMVENAHSERISVHLYPNPARDYFIVSADVMVYGIQIFDYSGKQVMNEKFTPVMMKTIDANAFANGIYQMIIHSERGEVSERFVVIH